EAALANHASALAAKIAANIGESGPRILVLGTEELMYAPMVIAAALADSTDGSVRYQSTTRSPVAPLDREGYAVRCALAFAPADPCDEPERLSYVYNVRPGCADHIVVVTDGGDTAPMVDAL